MVNMHVSVVNTCMCSFANCCVVHTYGTAYVPTYGAAYMRNEHIPAYGTEKDGGVTLCASQNKRYAAHEGTIARTIYLLYDSIQYPSLKYVILYIFWIFHIVQYYMLSTQHFHIYT